MAIGKPRGKKGVIPVYVHDPAAGRKVYVKPEDHGMSPPTTVRAARTLERRAKQAMEESGLQRTSWTVLAWREHWLEKRHGANTPRPESTTKSHNAQATKHFMSEYGERSIGSIKRSEALEFLRKHRHQGKAVAAMFSDAVDAEVLAASPFARPGLPALRGRADIDPLTRQEIDRLVEIARRQLGLYGDMFAGFLTFLAWTGVRPGEACGLERADLDLTKGLADVRRTRRNDGAIAPTKNKQRRTVVVPKAALDAIWLIAPDDGPIFRTATGKPLLPNSYRYYWQRVRTAFMETLPTSHWLPRRVAEKDEHLDVYELRHFCGSFLAAKGYSAREISTQLGNTPAVCERVYLHDYRDQVLERLRRGFDEPQPLRDVASDEGVGEVG